MSTEGDRVQAAAVATVEQLINALTANGWHYVQVSIAALVRTPAGGFETPGASSFGADPRMMPALPEQARALRSLADELDKAHRNSGAVRADGYIQTLYGPSVDERKRGGGG